MNCPFCNHRQTAVIRTIRYIGPTGSLKRRRICNKCKKTFSTYEHVERGAVSVLQANGRRDLWKRDRLAASIRRATYKHYIADSDLDTVIDDVEITLILPVRDTVPADAITQRAARQLALLDPVVAFRYLLQVTDPALEDLVTLLKRVEGWT